MNRGGSCACRGAAAAESVLRRMGQALDLVAALGSELVDAAGGEFLGTPGKEISAEEIARMDPDVVIAAWCGAGDRVPLNKIIAERGWQGTGAARASRVYCIRDGYHNTPAPTLLQGLDALAFAIHPEWFERAKGIRQITSVASSIDMNPVP